MSDIQETSKEKGKKAPVLDWTPPSSKKGPPKHIEDTAAYPKNSQDSKYAATTPLTRKQTLEVAQEKEQVGGPWKKRWLATRHHVRRYWYWYVPMAIVLLAVALVILFLVIIPAIAQLVVNKAALPLHAAALGNPSENSTQFSLVTSIKMPAGLSANLMPINLSLSGKTDKTPYAQVSLPKYHLKGTTTITVTNQTAAITNMDSFVRFLKTAMYQRNFTLNAYGKTNVYLGKLKCPVTLNKNIDLPGLQNLTGFGLTSAKIVLPAEADGSNFIGNASIPNYSVIKLELGNLTMNMLMGGINVGIATISDATLLPGNNTLPIRATLDLKTILANIGPILASQASALKNGTLAIQSSGNSTVYNGQHLTYFEDVLNPLTITAYVPIKTILSGTLGGLVDSTDAVVAKLGELASGIKL